MSFIFKDGLECSPVNPLLMNHHHLTPSFSSFTASTAMTTENELDHLDALRIGGGHEEQSGMMSNEDMSNATKGGVGENLLSKPKSDSVATAMDDCVKADAADDMDMTM
jgi:hypothetical protein